MFAKTVFQFFRFVVEFNSFVRQPTIIGPPCLSLTEGLTNAHHRIHTEKAQQTHLGMATKEDSVRRLKPIQPVRGHPVVDVISLTQRQPYVDVRENQ